MATILVVEDQNNVRKIVRTSLETAGHTVAEAVDAASALRVAGEVLPQAIIMDWVLPGGDGLVVARRIRSGVLELASVPVIVFTALTVEPQKKRGLVREFGGFVAKTAGSAALLGAVAAVLAKAALIVHEDEGIRSLLRRVFEELGFFVKTGRIEGAFRETTLDVRPWRWTVVQGSVALREAAWVERLREVSDRVLIVTGGKAPDLGAIRPFCDEVLELPVTRDDLARVIDEPQRP